MTDYKGKDSSGFDSGERYAGTDSIVLESRFVADALRDQERRHAVIKSLDAAVGIKNGVLIGILAWTFIFLLFRVLGP